MFHHLIVAVLALGDYTGFDHLREHESAVFLLLDLPSEHHQLGSLRFFLLLLEPLLLLQFLEFSSSTTTLAADLEQAH